jgi:hypothetical protein
VRCSDSDSSASTVMQVWLKPADTCAGGGVQCCLQTQNVWCLPDTHHGTQLTHFAVLCQQPWLHLQHPPGLGDLAVISVEALLLRDHPPVRRHDLSTAHEGLLCAVDAQQQEQLYAVGLSA